MSEINKNHFRGKVVHFATKHEKERALEPLLAEAGMSCVKVDVDTDLFGTFTGEVERSGTVRETLRQKLRAAADKTPEAHLFLASEGSFGPHPLVGLLPTDLESLLLWDKTLDIEIYAEYLCQSPVHAEQIVAPGHDFRNFLKRVKFPDHGVIVRPDRKMSPIYKGLHREHEVVQAMIDCFTASENGKVMLTTDLRANHNPTRMKAIYQAGLRLIEKLSSHCPSCEFPGFAPTRGVPGLPCEECGERTRQNQRVLWACVACDFTEERPRPDGKMTADSSECDFCNP